MSRISAINDSVSKTKCIISDLDNTLCKGRVSESIGIGYIKKDIVDGNYARAFRGLNGALKIIMMLRKGDENTKDIDGLKMFYETLIENHIGDAALMERFSRTHMLRKSIPPVAEMVCNAQIPSILATQSGSTAAHSAKSLFRFTEVISNLDIFDNNGRLMGIKVIMANGESKLELVKSALDRLNIRIRDCTVVGDSVVDVPMLMSARIRVASPFAKKSVLELPNIIAL